MEKKWDRGEDGVAWTSADEERSMSALVKKSLPDSCATSGDSQLFPLSHVGKNSGNKSTSVLSSRTAAKPRKKAARKQGLEKSTTGSSEQPRPRQLFDELHKFVSISSSSGKKTANRQLAVRLGAKVRNPYMNYKTLKADLKAAKVRRRLEREECRVLVESTAPTLKKQRGKSTKKKRSNV